MFNITVTCSDGWELGQNSNKLEVYSEMFSLAEMIEMQVADLILWLTYYWAPLILQ